MRIGLGISLVSHAALLAVGLMSLGGPEPFDPTEIEAIPIELVPIDSISNVRFGSLDSNVIETEAPSAVDADKPAEIAEPTGNTEENQPTPEETENVTPAPTDQTAPEPQPEPVVEPTPVEPIPERPQPEVVPEPEPTPPTPPAPAPQPEPEPVVEPTPATPDPIQEVIAANDTAAEPEVQAPMPPTLTAALDQARSQAAPKPAQSSKTTDNTEKADKISDIINKEDSRGATTGSGGSKTAGKTTGTSARLSQSEKAALAAKMRECFFPPLSARNVDGLFVRLLIDMNRDGSVAGTPQVLEISIQNAVGVATASAAQRAVRKCAPYSDILKPESFDEWRQIEVKFDPKDAL